MNADGQMKAKQTESLVKDVGLPKLLSYFTSADLLVALRLTGLHQFLINVPSFQLRAALDEREEMEDDQARHNLHSKMKYNVLDFTIQQLVKHCWDNRLIKFVEYSNSTYTMSNHYELGMRLVSSFPNKYKVGTNSHHFNCARKIQSMYGLDRRKPGKKEHQDQASQLQEGDQQDEHDKEDQDNDNEDQQYEQNEQNEEEEFHEDQQISHDSDLINDEEQKSDYEISLQQLSQNQRQKKRRIKKSKGQGAGKRKVGRQRLRRAAKTKDKNGTSHVWPQDIFEQESQGCPKNMISSERKCKKRKLNIDSD